MPRDNISWRDSERTEPRVRNGNLSKDSQRKEGALWIPCGLTWKK
jgi:hypothetical protein